MNEARKGPSPSWLFAKLVLTPGLRLVLRMRVLGRENLLLDRPQIIASNHTSHADPLMVGYATGLETWFLAKEEIFRVSKAFARLLSTYHALPVNRGAGDVGALRKCSELLQQGKSLVLFPEGSRSVSGLLQPLRPGVSMLAIMNQVPVVPTFIAGARRSFLPWLVDPDIVRKNERARPGSMRFRADSLFDSRIRVIFGRPIRPDGFSRCKADYRRFAEILTGAFRETARENAER